MIRCRIPQMGLNCESSSELNRNGSLLDECLSGLSEKPGSKDARSMFWGQQGRGKNEVER